MIKIINIAVLGDKNVGKTEYISQITESARRTNEKPKKLDMKSVILNTYHGTMHCIFWDFSINYINIQNLKKMDGFIVLFDLTNNESFSNTIELLEVLNQTFQEIPIVLCGNKSEDMQNIKLTKYDIINKILNNSNIKIISYYDISCRSLHNVEYPYIDILKKIENDHNIFVAYKKCEKL